MPEHVELLVRVTERGTINVKHCAYSLPSRLRDKQVKVRLHEDRIEVYFNERLQLSCERVIGRRRRIDYRHVIWSLVRKPGGFARYAYREEMFPTAVFKSAYEAIRATRSNTAGDLEYLRILHLAASTMEADVQAALSLLLSEQKAITIDAVKALVVVGTGPSVPAMTLPDVDLTEYDALLVEVGT